MPFMNNVCKHFCRLNCNCEVSCDIGMKIKILSDISNLLNMPCITKSFDFSDVLTLWISQYN